MKPTLQEIIDRAKRDIEASMKTPKGLLPAHVIGVPMIVASFEQLHDFVDANEYLGDEYDAGTPEGETILNAAVDALGAWLARGRTDEPVRMGVFTPWGEALCIPCHEGASAESTWQPITEALMQTRFDENPRAWWSGFCTKCDKPMLIQRDDVAMLSRVRHVLVNSTDFAPAVTLDQTGGMCVALAYDRADGKRVMVTYGMCATEKDGPFNLEIGVYPQDDDGVGYEADSFAMVRGDDETMAQAVREVCA